MSESSRNPMDGERFARRGEQTTVWILWFTYGAFYFCRTNISAAVPGLKGPLDAGGLALTGEQVGWILASLKISYGIGQLVTGQLAERYSARWLLAAGMFGSALLNVLFGFSTGAYFLLFVWATNGFCQSLGWTPTVRVMANWVPVLRRGRAVGVIGTGYQITLGLTYLIAGQSAEFLGWRAALYVPAVLLATAGVLMVARLRESPDDGDGEPSPRGNPSGAVEAGSTKEIGAVPGAARGSVVPALYWTLYNPALWLMGLALGLLNACRYGFLDWGVSHLMETQETGVGKAVLQFFVIAIGATAGSYLAGWATDRFFGGRRAPVICLLMIALGAICLAYDHVARSSAIGTMVLLVVVGFCIYGPQVLLVGTAPADLAHRGHSAAAAGFVNFLGYMGAATGDVVTGHYASPEHGGWRVAIYIWAGWAFVGAAITGLLWNTTSRRITVVPEHVPRWTSLGCLIAFQAIAWHEGYPLETIGMAGMAAFGLLMSGRLRGAAVLGFAIAPLVLWKIFRLNGASDAGTWHAPAAMALLGLAILTALMVLVGTGGDRASDERSAPNGEGP